MYSNQLYFPDQIVIFLLHRLLKLDERKKERKEERAFYRQQNRLVGEGENTRRKRIEEVEDLKESITAQMDVTGGNSEK